MGGLLLCTKLSRRVFLKEVMYLFIMDQCCKEDMAVIGKSALTTGLEILQDVANGENVKTVAKKRLKENSVAFLDDTVSRMALRQSIKGSMNKQIAIRSSRPNKPKHKSGQLDDTIFSKLKKERNSKWSNLFTEILMTAVLRVLIFSYFLL